MKPPIDGMGPDTAIFANERGGKQSDIPFSFHLMDAPAMFKLAERLHYGAKKYSRDNWRKIDADEHFNHMIAHAYAYLSGDREDDHLGAVICRAMMAVAVALTDEADLKREINQVMNHFEIQGDGRITKTDLDRALQYEEVEVPRWVNTIPREMSAGLQDIVQEAMGIKGQSWPHNVGGKPRRPVDPFHPQRACGPSCPAGGH